MHIFIDESGTFLPTDAPVSYSAVAALVVPDDALGSYAHALDALKEQKGVARSSEVKLRDLSATDYFSFLESLVGAGGFVTGTASDAGYNAAAAPHQAQQAANFRLLKGPTNDEAVDTRIEQDALAIEKLSLQNYIELRCRCELNVEVMQAALRWMPRHSPASLSTFRWCIDAKETTPNHFDKTFRRLFTTLTLAELKAHPLELMPGANYSGLAPFTRGWGDRTMQPGQPGPSLDAQKMWGDDLVFARSVDVAGLQVIDLIVSGLRRVLRGDFADNDRAATLLGSLCIARPDGDVVKIVGIGVGPEAKTHRETVRTLHLLSAAAM
jgi:hypothetical protein